MSKKKINKIKTKQKQRQKQTQNVIVNIHKSTRTRKPTNNKTPRRNVQQLPTPQYIYTSQTDNLVPQMFNKQGQQETLAEQINKTLDEKINKLVLEHTTKPTQPTQPTQQEVSNKPQPTQQEVSNKPQPTQQKVPDIFTNKLQPQLSNIQQDKPAINEPKLVKSEHETIHSIINKKPLLPNDELEKIKKLQEDMIKKKNEEIKKNLDSGYVTEGGGEMKEKNSETIKEEERKKRSKWRNQLNNLIEESNVITDKLTEQKTKKETAVHGSKGPINLLIKEYESDLKPYTLKIESIRSQIKKSKDLSNSLKK